MLGVGELDSLGMPPIAVLAVGSERGHLDGVPFRPDEHHAEGLAHALGPAEELLDLRRPRVGRDVVVGRIVPPEAVAHATAGTVRHVAGGAELAHDLHRRAS